LQLVGIFTQKGKNGQNQKKKTTEGARPIMKGGLAEGGTGYFKKKKKKRGRRSRGWSVKRTGSGEKNGVNTWGGGRLTKALGRFKKMKRVVDVIRTRERCEQKRSLI